MFRSYRYLNLVLKQGLSVFYGGNGQGKSNLIEAIYMLSIAKSLRTNSISELIHWDLQHSDVQAHIRGIAISNSGKSEVQITFNNSQSSYNEKQHIVKSLKVDGVVQSRQEDFVGQVKAACFDVNDILVITGQPVARRKFLDILISKTNTNYLKTLQRYRLALLQRNNLLKGIRERYYDIGLLEFWNERLAYEAAIIVNERSIAIETLAKEVSKLDCLFPALSGLSLVYLPCIFDNFQQTRENARSGIPADIQNTILKHLNLLEKREIAQGTTLIGPHRDDFLINYNQKQARRYASRGELRILALSLKLAEAGYTQSITGETPIILLDDVFSELDQRYRNFILETISSYKQVIITTTDLSVFSPEIISQASLFSISSGDITAN